MATPPSLTQIAFAAGLDEGQQAEVLDPAVAFPVIQNARQDRRGGFSKRLGYASTTKSRASGSRSAGARMFAHNGTPCVIDGSYLDAYSDAATLSTTRSRVPEATYRVLDIASPSSNALVQDVEYCNGFVAVGYGYNQAASSSPVASNALALLQQSDGSTVIDPAVFGSGPGVVLIASFGLYLIAFHYNDSTTAITASLLWTGAPANGWSTLGTVAATSSNAYPSVCSLSDRVAIAYGTTSGTSRVTVKTYNAMGLVDTTTLAAAQTPGKISLDGSNAGTLWVAFSQALVVHAIGITGNSLSTVQASDVSALTATTGVINLGICEGSAAGTARVWVLSNTGAPARMYMCGLTTSAGAAVAGATKTVYNVVPSSRAFQVGGRYYMAFATGTVGVDVASNAQANCIVADWTYDQAADDNQLRPIANLEPGLIPSIGFFCKASPVSSTKRIYGFQIAKSGTATVAKIISGESATGCMLAELDFGSRARWQPAKHGGSTFLGGALTSVFDGVSVAEAGFLCRPTLPTTVLSAGVLSPTTGYRYVAVYESVDASGNTIVSGVSSPSASVVKPVAQNVAVTSAGLGITARALANWRVVFYRTTDGGNPPYYRIGVGTFNAATFLYDYADSTDDVTLAAKRKLYAPNLPGTLGESQDRRAPPGLVSLVSFNGMLVGSKGSTLFYSGQEVYGEATWFTPLFQQPVSGGGTDITALAVQDGTLYVFKRKSIFSVSGEPPSDNGASGGLGTPRRLACDVGCVEANSVVATSSGIFFQSDSGIYLLSRSGEVSWVGRAIQSTLASYPLVTSAVLDDRNGLVRFSLAPVETAGIVSGSGRDVVWDLNLDTWVSVDSKTGVLSSESSQDACLFYLGGVWRYGWLGTDGTVYYERLSTDASAYLDGSTWVTLAVETGSFKAGGIQGRQQLNHVLALARKSTDFDLAVSLSYNYEASFRTARTFSHTEISNLLSAGWPITQLKHEPHDDGDGEAVRVRIADATPTSGTVGSGKGATLIALTLDITPKPGVFDVPEGAT